MNSKSPTYRLSHANWSLQFSASATAVLSKHVQGRLFSRETVGQLYTRNLVTNDIVIDVATVLPPVRAAWSSVSFDTQRAMTERETLFHDGLHCIGLWHTHPEPHPTPSSKDRVLARDHALAAKPQLSALVFAILGTALLPSGLRVWIDDGTDLQEADVVAPLCVDAVHDHNPVLMP